MKRILILDSDPDMLESLRRILRPSGCECLAATDPGHALTLLQSHPPDLLLTELGMPSMDGIEFLRRVRELDPALPVVVLTAFASIESAVAAVREGAVDYLAKPFSMDQLKLVVRRALRRQRPENAPARAVERPHGFDAVVGQSPALRSALDLARRAARSETSVLVRGESGTGKELIAHAIHNNGRRYRQPFVAVDCASLPENLLESELFGHEKGAFTGASSAKLGLMELAHRGTLFLDEIGELPVGLQAKLLRVLQEKQLRRVGGTRQIDLDIRVVCATNADLGERIARGRFRLDLYYRINVIEIALPPLRERDGDAALLADTFLTKYAAVEGKRLDGFEPDALRMLEAYSWPGNVRELQNVIQRACALTEHSAISAKDLPPHLLAVKNVTRPGTLFPAAPLSLKDAKAQWMASLEAACLSDQLKNHDGNISRTARALGVDRRTVHRMLNKHRLD